MKKMKRNVLLIPFVAVLALMLVSFASAVTFDIVKVEVDGAALSPGANNDGFAAGSTVPVRVWFEADDNQSNVEIEVEFQGYDDTETVSQDFGYVEADTEYRSKIFNMRIPNDVDDASEETVLYVTVSSRDGEARVSYELKLQRESYELDVLSVDYSSRVSAGDVFPVSVVVENNGYGFTEDNFVIVSISALGVSTRGYIGDLDSIENYDNDNHEEDAMQKTVYLEIPADAESGVYEMEVIVYNDDSKTTVGNLIAVDGVDSVDGSDVLGEETDEVSTSVVALTVVLVIIFVVLLAVLVVLLTKKEKPIDEVETSYY
ncbi:MAG TPA: hypothetical protein ENH20_00325 [Candidatus Pacearchaeota archaeon]|nr:hypothetical protein [Candidatus Pacearchaeota archaeon]